MNRRIIALVTVMVLLPSALCAIDTSPYTNLATELNQKQSLLSAAQARGDAGQMITLSQEINALTSQLAAPRMQFLKRYSDIQKPLEESQYLIGQIEVNMPNVAEAKKAPLESIQQTVSSIEVFYASENYTAAAAKLVTITSTAMGMPASLASACSDEVSQIKSEMDRTSTMTPSTVSMLDNAKKKFTDARKNYDDASKKILEAKPAEADSLFASARKLVLEGFDLIGRSRQESGGDLLGPLKYALVIGPVALIIALLAFFYLQFNKTAVKCSVSKTSVKSGTLGEIERKIEVSNPEKERVFAMVVDQMPLELAAEGFNIAPSDQIGSELVWQSFLDPGKKMSLSYKLKFSSLDKGVTLKLPGASISYAFDGQQKKFSGKAYEIIVN